MKKFDLNIEKILENWEVFHAIREIIANALDEQLITKSSEVEIYRRGQSWYIRDFGRGLKHTHLTQNENQEKLQNPDVIGKFGIGLKDALATFERNGVKIKIYSSHNTISIAKAEKAEFNDIVTLHAVIETDNTKEIQGTLVEITGVTNADIGKAKNLFLKFSGETVLESTKHGQIIERNTELANIYINGVKVAQEENFLFSYNITNLNTAIKRALNRERTNVGRSAYSETIKKILLSSSFREVAEILASDLININSGNAHDELGWLDVQEHSVKLLNQKGKYLFVTAFETIGFPSMIDQAKRTNYQIIIIPENLKNRIRGLADVLGDPIVDIDQFVSDYQDSFEFNFVKIEELNYQERQNYSFTPLVVRIFGGQPPQVNEIRISDTMRTDLFSNVETLGCWDLKTGNIIINRKALSSLSEYSGALIHELIHASTGYTDVTRNFESSLTQMIGSLCENILNQIEDNPDYTLPPKKYPWWRKLPISISFFKGK